MSMTDQIKQAEAELAALTEKRDRQQGKVARATMKRNVLNRQVYEVNERLKALKRVPEPGSDVITFRKAFAGSGKVYMYAAIRSNRLWYATGITGPNGVPWEQLADFIRKDNTLPFAFEARWGGYANGITITPSTGRILR